MRSRHITAPDFQMPHGQRQRRCTLAGVGAAAACWEPKQASLMAFQRGQALSHVVLHADVQLRVAQLPPQLLRSEVEAAAACNGGLGLRLQKLRLLQTQQGGPRQLEGAVQEDATLPPSAPCHACGWPRHSEQAGIRVDSWARVQQRSGSPCGPTWLIVLNMMLSFAASSKSRLEA